MVVHNVPHSEKTKNRLRQVELAKVAKDPVAYSKRMASYRIGKKMPLDAIEKIRAFQKKKVFSTETRKKISDAKRGAHHHWWKGGVTKKNYTERKVFMNTYEYKQWREAVYKRDNWTCVECAVRGQNLEADHIKPYALFPELRLEVGNGRTLCKKCHRRVGEKVNQYSR